MTAKTPFLIASSLILLLSSTLTAQAITLPGINVIENRDAIDSIPGTAEIIDSETLEKSQVLHTNEALRKVPGVYVRDEDGIGLRPNISIRGIAGDRSRKILVLEDGAPISLAPYGENGAYYIPQIDRVDRIEVLKGSGSILYGPQTVGGVINLITKKPYDTPSTGLGLSFGTQGAQAYQLRKGGTWNNIGLDTFISHKTGNGPRSDMDYNIYDLSQKFNFKLDEKNKVGIKLHYYKEESNTSYLGLTKAMYEADASQNPAINDTFYVERFGITGSHQYTANKDLKVKTLAYAYSSRRDWWRQDFDRADNADQGADGGFDGNTNSDGKDANGNDYTRIIGNGNNTGDSIFFKDSNGGRNRVYKVVGIEPRVEYKNYKAGLKVHYETEKNQRINGSSATARSGELKTDENRSTFATALYGQANYEINEKWHVIPGLRLEAYNQVRDIQRKSNAHADISNSTGMTVVTIPGVGTTYDYSDSINIFAGIHRGFTPPRFNTAINDSGQDQQLDAEESWNYEVGVRTQPKDGLNVDVTAFIYDYQKQIVDASESSGFDKANEKNTESKGIEISVNSEHKLKKGRLNPFINLTVLESKFKTGDNKGNSLPYSPELLARAGINFQHKSGVNVLAEGIHVGSMFSDNSNTETETENGLTGKIDAHTLFNLTVSYQKDAKTTYFIAAKNIFDEKYIASRSPSGIFPGHEQQINAGVKINI